MTRVTVDFQPVFWSSKDYEESEDVEIICESDATHRLPSKHMVDIYGKTSGGESVCVHIPVFPYFFIEIDLNTQKAQLTKLIMDLRKGMGDLGRDLVSHSCLKGRSFVGHSSDASKGFCRLNFTSRSAFYKAVSWFRYKKKDTSIYESNVDPVVRLLQDKHLEPFAPMRAMGFGESDGGLRVTSCDVELTLCSGPGTVNDDTTQDLASLYPPNSSGNDKSASNLIIASFDIECIAPGGGFPDAARKEDAIITICTCFSKMGAIAPYRKVAITLGDVERDDGAKEMKHNGEPVELICESSEAKLLGTWARLLEEERIDILTGYNIWGFDMRYIHRRVLLNGGSLNPSLRDFARNMSRLSDTCLSTTQTNVKSCGPTVNEATMISTTGILQMDLYYYAKRFVSNALESYKLSAVCAVFLGTDKDDGKTGLSIKEMNETWATGSPKDKWKVIEYCIQDALLVTRLVERMAALHNIFEMANVCGVPPSVVLLQGEQVKVYSLILRHTRRMGMFCPTLYNDNKPGEEGASAAPQNLQGATVLEPDVGAYWEPVVCLDFQSLYPSIMMAHNLCHSTCCLRPGRPAPSASSNTDTRSLEAGVLPRLLRELQAKRVAAKDEMTRARNRGDEYMEAVFNAKQLAYKVSMNSVYGFCGASKGILPCHEVASAITAIGREMIARTKKYIEEEMQVGILSTQQQRPRVVYGDTDSVMIRFPFQTVEECVELGRRAAKEVSALFPEPIRLCYEKCYAPYILFSKKRYVGLIQPQGEVDCKGVQFVRKDTCPFVKETCQTTINILLHKCDVRDAIAHVQRAASDLLEGRVSMDALVVQKSIGASAKRILADEERRCLGCAAGEGSCQMTQRKGEENLLTCTHCGASRTMAYKSTATPALQVALRMEKDPLQQGPKAGDMVPFIFVRVPEPKGKQKNASTTICTDKAEHPIIAKDRGMEVDGRFYFDHHMKGIFVELFKLLLPSIFERKEDVPKSVEKFLFGEIVSCHDERVNKQPRMTRYFPNIV